MQFYDPFFLPKLSFYLRGSRAADARAVHCFAFKLGCLLSSTFLSNNLLHAYRSSSFTSARQLFDEIPHPNAVTWSIMNSAYSHTCNIKDVILVFRRMQRLGIPPNSFVFSSIFTRCAHSRDILTGIQIHSSSVKFGFIQNTFVFCTLIDMYARCGMVGESWRVFDESPEKDVVSWTTMITCLANLEQHEGSRSTFELFKEMIFSGIWPVEMTFVSVLRGFDEPVKLRQAIQVHGCMVKLGIEVDGPMGTCLIAMYGRCGSLEEAVKVFDIIDNDVVSWTSLLVAYTQNGCYNKAAYLFQKMVEEKIVIDSFTVASIIGVFSYIKDVCKGKLKWLRNCFSS